MKNDFDFIREKIENSDIKAPESLSESAVRAMLEKLPRERVSGTILTVIALLWCIPNIRPIFQPDSPFQTIRESPFSRR